MQTRTRTSTHIILFLFAFITFFTSVGAQAKHWKIMPVGDSITKGEQSTDSTGFRKILFDKLDASNVDFEFVGDDIGPDGDPNYRGFFESGAKIDYFLPEGTKDLMAQLDKNNADIVLIHLGTNNMNKDAAGPYTDPTTASGKLYSLLNDLTQRTDLTRIVVCKIIPEMDDYGQVKPKIQEFNAQIEQMFFDNFAGDIVTLADMNSIIDVNTQMSSDNIHPNDDGYQQMANMYSYIIQGINNNGGLINADTTPPGQISWVKGESLEESAYIEWYVPADDGSNGDRANLYELRYSTNELDDNNFSQGTLVSRARPGEPGSTDSDTIDGLVAGLTYHFAIRAYDEHNNKSILSNDIPVSISEPGREVCDDFSDPSLLNWQVNPAYQVLNDELVNTSSSPPGWNYLAIFTEATYNANAGNVNASFTWSNSADVDGINATGIAMLLDKKDYSSANGYLVRIRERKVYLETIVNGQPQTPQLAKENFDANAPDPQPGDTLRISYSPSTTNGYVFNVYINK
ncbi:MAG: hypothetical protein GXO75_01020, partial [Calditrichaeota bacterium]|nr:hypothetical protein [Calditrichota bacterium]